MQILANSYAAGHAEIDAEEVRRMDRESLTRDLYESSKAFRSFWAQMVKHDSEQAEFWHGQFEQSKARLAEWNSIHSTHTTRMIEQGLYDTADRMEPAKDKLADAILDTAEPKHELNLSESDVSITQGRGPAFDEGGE
jgi:uncharacterized protein YcaQ